MNLLISENGRVLGQTYSADNAIRHVLVAKSKPVPERAKYAVTKPNDFNFIDQCVLDTMLMDWEVDTAMQLWNLFKKKTFPYCGKVSVKDVVRAIFDDDELALTQDQLIEAIPGATWISITTAFSMLKNRKYAKPGKVLEISRIEGKYRRQVA